VTSDATPPLRRQRRLADPSRFAPARASSKPLTFLFVGAVLLGGCLAAVPREVPGVAVATVLGGAWLSLVLALTLPTASERAGAELVHRLGEFRHAVNALGDDPTRDDLERVLQLAATLGLREDEIRPELAQIRASLDALTLREQMRGGHLPIVSGVESLPAGDDCHFAAPVRFGRRKADQCGRLLLTTGWLKFRGGLDVSIAWSEVGLVQRAGRDIIVALEDSRRILRFTCPTLEDAARGSVIAEYLAQTARRGEPDGAPRLYDAAV
jgi:hypothetical protein